MELLLVFVFAVLVLYYFYFQKTHQQKALQKPKSLTLDLLPTKTIKELKDTLFKSFGIPIDQQKVFDQDGTLLDDSMPVGLCSLRSNGTLKLTAYNTDFQLAINLNQQKQQKEDKSTIVSSAERIRDKEKDNSSSSSSSRYRETEREKEKERDKDKDREKEREKERDRDKDRDRDRDREKDRDKDRDRDREKERDRDKDRDRDRDREKDRDKDRDRDREKERDRDKDRDRDRDREKERDRDRERDRDKDREKERDRDRDREKDKERERMHRASENTSASSSTARGMEGKTEAPEKIYRENKPKLEGPELPDQSKTQHKTSSTTSSSPPVDQILAENRSKLETMEKQMKEAQRQYEQKQQEYKHKIDALEKALKETQKPTPSPSSLTPPTLDNISELEKIIEEKNKELKDMQVKYDSLYSHFFVKKQNNEGLRAKLKTLKTEIDEEKKKEKEKEKQQSSTGPPPCGVCLTEEKDTALIPCGHTFCSDCVSGMCIHDTNLCPICRKPFRDCVKFFV